MVLVFYLLIDKSLGQKTKQQYRGFIVAGRVGTGLVVAKTEEGVWSAPSAIATMGMGWGALIGGEITDFVLVLNTDSAVESFSGARSLHCI